MGDSTASRAGTSSLLEQRSELERQLHATRQQLLQSERQSQLRLLQQQEQKMRQQREKQQSERQQRERQQREQQRWEQTQREQREQQREKQQQQQREQRQREQQQREQLKRASSAQPFGASLDKRMKNTPETMLPSKEVLAAGGTLYGTASAWWSAVKKPGVCSGKHILVNGTPLKDTARACGGLGAPS